MSTPNSTSEYKQEVDGFIQKAQGRATMEAIMYLLAALVQAVMFVGYCILYGINKGE